MNDLYLILHKVRGEPAFDVAQKIMIGGEEGWIVPTSGHRAYPIATRELARLDIDIFAGDFIKDEDGWPDLPDHYSTTRDDHSYLEEEARSLLIRRGLIKPTPPNNYRRR